MGSAARVTCGVLAALAVLAAHAREIPLDERVAAQEAIEQVYWSHRIWPESNPSPKPLLSEVMPEAAIRAKVERTLRLSLALDVVWNRPVTGEQLHAELGRMTAGSRNGALLKELFQALGNDPELIAETLA